MFLTVASVVVALDSDSSPAAPSQDSLVAAATVAPRTGVEPGAVEADAAAARDFVLAQRAAASRELTAENLSDDVKAARQDVAERATRDAERAKLATLAPRALGQVLAAEAGWTGSQWTCLDSLWMRESKWDPSARNSSSGAFGIPQALPGSKMASAGADWATNPATQIAWGFSYIRARYGSPCGAWSHSQSDGWY